MHASAAVDTIESESGPSAGAESTYELRNANEGKDARSFPRTAYAQLPGKPSLLAPGSLQF